MKIVRTPSGQVLVAEPRVSENFGSSRSSYIGGTDLAPILGVSEKRTRFAVWAAKVRVEVKEDDSTEEEAAAGSYYEPFILQRFGLRYPNVKVHPTQITFRRREALFLAANPDALVMRGRTPLGVVDAKTRSPFQRSKWGDAGTASVPPDELCQVQWYMEILDLPVAYLAVFFDRSLVTFVVPRDRELGALMTEEATAFWNDFVLPRREPPFEGAAAKDYLYRKYPHEKTPLREATVADDALVAAQAVLKQHMEQLQLRLDAVEGEIKNRIGDAEGVQGRGYKVRWYDINARNLVDWKAVVAELRSFPVVADEETAAAIRSQIDEAIARYTHQSTPSRGLKITFKGPRAIVATETVEALTSQAALPAAEEGEK